VPPSPEGETDPNCFTRERTLRRFAVRQCYRFLSLCVCVLRLFTLRTAAAAGPRSGCWSAYPYSYVHSVIRLGAVQALVTCLAGLAAMLAIAPLYTFFLRCRNATQEQPKQLPVALSDRMSYGFLPAYGVHERPR